MEKSKFDILHRLLVFVTVSCCIGFASITWRAVILGQEIKNLTEANTAVIVETKILKKNAVVEDKKVDIRGSLSAALTHLNPRVDPLIKEQIVDALITESEKQNLPPLLPLCVIRFESNFNPLIKNKLGASGLMQVIPKYHQDKIDEYGWKPHEVFFIENNILLGCQILKEYFETTDNDIGKALQKYVGAIEKKNAGTYIEDIINSYLSLDIIYFMKNQKKLEEEEAIIENIENIIENNESQ